MQNSINLKEDEPFEIADEDEPESPTTSDESQVVEPPPQSSQRDPAPWILASRKPHIPQQPLDAEFMLHMAGIRRQIDGASLRSTNSTLQILGLGSCVSLDSSVFSDSCSVVSLSLEDEFPPTPVFRDEIPKGLMTKIESPFFAAQTPKGNSASLLNSGSPQHTPTPTGPVRRGYWNRRGDHLTPDGHIVFPPPNMQYPEELRMYPFENEGYQDHSGLFIAYIRRPELPQSLPKHGNPPERPYESVRFFLTRSVEQQLLICHILILVCELSLSNSLKTTCTCGRNWTRRAHSKWLGKFTMRILLGPGEVCLGDSI